MNITVVFVSGVQYRPLLGAVRSVRVYDGWRIARDGDPTRSAYVQYVARHSGHSGQRI